jgi:hypothetical protein
MHNSCNLEARKLVSDPTTAQPLASVDFLVKKLLILFMLTQIEKNTDS